MAHLDGFAERVPSGSAVKQGQVVGYVGATGNATGTHVHFEVRTGGGTSNPRPVLDRWLDEALAAAPGLVASFKGLEASLPRPLAATGVLRRFDERPVASAVALDALAWASTVSPGGDPVARAERRAQQSVTVLMEHPGVAVRQASSDAWRQAEKLGRAVLSPLTPDALVGVAAAGAETVGSATR
jgi:hypothetical protein